MDGRGTMLSVFLAVLAVAAALVLDVPGASAETVRPFTPAFQADLHGGITTAANSLLTCSVSTDPTTCSTAQRSSSASNNSFSMVPINTAGGATSSSSATLTVPSGARVAYAVLAWSAQQDKGGPTGAPAAGAPGQVRFRVPGGAYRDVTADRVDASGSGQGRAYQGTADVTDLVAAVGSGSYAVADLAAATGIDRYAGWSLTVAYEDQVMPLRNLTVYDGFVVARQGESLDLPISGFLTPPTGPVRADVGIVAYEGDQSGGDSLQINGTKLSNALHPANNAFDSHLDRDGFPLDDRNPDFANTLGIDATSFQAGDQIPAGSTAATLTVATNRDIVYPGVITTAIDIFRPDLTGPGRTKTVTDLDGTPTMPGHRLCYRITAENNGADDTVGALAVDALPAGVAYVPGSLRVDGRTVTDRAGDDAGQVIDRMVRVGLGAGAHSAIGGRLAPGASATVTFEALVTDAAAGTTVDNAGTLTYRGTGSSRTYTTPTATVSTPVQSSPIDVRTDVGPPDPASGTVPVDVTITDNGGSAIEDIAVTTDPAAGLDCPAAGSLPAHGTAILHCSVRIPAVPEDLTLTVVGTPVGGSPVVFSATITVPDRSGSSAVPGEPTGGANGGGSSGGSGGGAPTRTPPGTTSPGAPAPTSTRTSTPTSTPAPGVRGSGAGQVSVVPVGAPDTGGGPAGQGASLIALGVGSLGAAVAFGLAWGMAGRRRRYGHRGGQVTR